MTIQQQKICAEVARHYGVAKKVVVEQVKEYLAGENDPVIEISAFGNDHHRFAASKYTLGLSAMLKIKSVKKSELYGEFINIVGNDDDIDCLCFESGKEIACMYARSLYNGVGGVFVREPGEDSGLVFEPFKNYLSAQYPTPLVD